MNTILTVLKKELIDTLRDRRTLLSAILIPILTTPLLIYGTIKISKMVMDKEKAKKLNVGLLAVPQEFSSTLDTSKYSLQVVTDLEEGREDILDEDLDGLIVFKDDFESKIVDLKSSKVNLFYKSTNMSVKSRLEKELKRYKDDLMDSRLVTLNLSKATMNPITIHNYDIAPPKEQIGKTVGGFLPYMFIIFCFTACMYPALDLITGEKERGTIETLLTAPASRLSILFGKMLAISLVGFVAAVMIVLGLFISLKFFPEIPEEMLESLNEMVSTKFILMLFAMLIPLSIFFAGLLSSIVIRAKSFKEAQSYVSPLMIFIILPAMVALMPGVELTWTTAMIPIANIALATKEILAGTIQMPHYFAILASLVILAIIAVLFSFKQISKESMLLK